MFRKFDIVIKLWIINYKYEREINYCVSNAMIELTNKRFVLIKKTRLKIIKKNIIYEFDYIFLSH